VNQPNPVSAFQTKYASHKHTLEYSEFLQILGYAAGVPAGCLYRHGSWPPNLSKGHVDKLWDKFRNGRKPIQVPLKEPGTTPDKAVEVIIGLDVGSEERGVLGSYTEMHRKAMAAENILGDFLERYIHSKTSKHGWVWCSGSVVKSTDFLRTANGRTKLLQIKNADNSENSSSQTVRTGTAITKWFRRYARKDDTYDWGKLPGVMGVAETFSESEFRQFIAETWAASVGSRT
jgi:hypothetical protein